MNVSVLPLLLPLATGVATLLVGGTSTRRVVTTASAGLQLLLALGLLVLNLQGEPLVLTVGGWSAKVGIVLVVDTLAAIMLVLSSFTAFICIIYSSIETPRRVEHPLRLPLLQFMMAGIHLAFITGDLFNLFVAFEIMLIASYALLTLEADDWDVKQAYPYLAINLFGSTLFICAAGLAYGLFGTLNFAGMIEGAQALSGDPRLTILALLFLVIFGTKAGLFPLYYWLPNSYPVLPAPIAGLFAGMLTKVGIYVLIRIFGTVLPHDLSSVHTLIAVLAGFTMILAVIGAISRNFVRGILSFHILSQIGFMALAIGLFTPLSIAACILYIIHHIVVKSALFLIGGIVAVLNQADDLDNTGHLWRLTPWVGILFLIQALSLAGIPPLSGFWGKYLIVLEGLREEAYVLVAASLVASVLTMMSMIKIWFGVFCAQPKGVSVQMQDRRWRPMCWIVGLMVAVSLCIGIGVEFVMQVATQAAEEALDQAAYVERVFAMSGKGGS